MGCKHAAPWVRTGRVLGSTHPSPRCDSYYGYMRQGLLWIFTKKLQRFLVMTADIPELSVNSVDFNFQGRIKVEAYSWHQPASCAKVNSRVIFICFAVYNRVPAQHTNHTAFFIMGFMKNAVCCCVLCTYPIINDQTNKQSRPLDCSISKSQCFCNMFYECKCVGGWVSCVSQGIHLWISVSCLWYLGADTWFVL